jgi:hypothetical protein
MSSKLTQTQITELEQKINSFEDFVESSEESYYENEKQQWEDGENSHMVTEGDTSEPTGFTLDEFLAEELEKVECSNQELIDFAVENNHFECEYEELGNPFDYGGAKENEFHFIHVGGELEVQHDLSNDEDYKLSFDLKSSFTSFKEFEDFVKYEIGSQDNLKHFYNLNVNKQKVFSTKYSCSADVVRVLLKNEDKLLEFIKSKPVKVDKFSPRVLKISESEFHDLRDSHSGFCEYCGSVNDGGHEPDAEKYECSNCEKKHSYGIEIAMMGGKVEIVDQEDSELEQAYN